MTTIALLIVLVLIGLALYFIPGIDATIRKLLIFIAVVLVVIWAIWMALGLLGRSDLDDFDGPRPVIVND